MSAAERQLRGVGGSSSVSRLMAARGATAGDGYWSVRCPVCGHAEYETASVTPDGRATCALGCEDSEVRRLLGLVPPASRGSRGPRGPELSGPFSSRAESGLARVGIAEVGCGPLDPHVRGRLSLGPSVAALEARWGADADGVFSCSLPGHTGRARLGVPSDDPDSDVRLLCCSGRWRSLGEVRAAEGYGVDQLRSNIEIAIWLRLLLYEAGRFTPAEVAPFELPEDVDEAVRSTLAGFRLLVGLRWADAPPRPVVFSVRFCAAWCGLTFRESRESIDTLLSLRAIEQAGMSGRNRLLLPAPEARR